MRDMDVKMLSAVDGIATVPESNRLVTELKTNSETEVINETKTVTRRTKK